VSDFFTRWHGASCPPTISYCFAGTSTQVTGTLDLNGATANIITDPATVASDWGSQNFAGGKSIFDDPSALIAITLPAGNDAQTEISFESNDPVVSGPILVNGIPNDPPLPGSVVPEPGTLALLGTALGGMVLRRRRRTTSGPK
jgi:hypothetical protein